MFQDSSIYLKFAFDDINNVSVKFKFPNTEIHTTLRTGYSNSRHQRVQKAVMSEEEKRTDLILTIRNGEDVLEGNFR